MVRSELDIVQMDSSRHEHANICDFHAPFGSSKYAQLPGVRPMDRGHRHAACSMLRVYDGVFPDTVTLEMSMQRDEDRLLCMLYHHLFIRSS